MKRKRRFRWVWILSGSLLIVGVGAYVAMDMAVSYTLKQMTAVVPSDPIATEGALEEPGTADSVVSQEESSDMPLEASSSNVADSESEAGAGAASPATQAPEPAQGKSDNDKPQEAVGYDPNISSEQAASVQENVTAREKLTVAGVLMDNFSAAELREFASIAAGGITVEEKKAARDTFLSRLSEEEYNELIAIAAKYGLSQGKSYVEVKESTEPMKE
ncbi:hypothetical protein FE782_11545 [Paenibacillus antri]|uniref:Uncharacterized protein n=1 Tax=Paenibacillus antri TaxID=2582848 RepID=A0A5R9G6J5_9BACL|nr:hypothetical protein [Paenibacillus antri]TLS52007.1 hypothetical protein FE782_11545 [Paenibacillus antri]